MTHYGHGGNHDDGRDIERRLSEAFDAKARGSVPEHRMPPPMRLPDHLSPHRHRRGRRHGPARWLAPLATAAAVLVVVAIVVGLSGGSTKHGTTGALGSPTITRSHSPSGSASASDTVSSSHSATAAPGKPVHVSLKFGDGARVGVGIPIIAFLSRPIKDARAFAQATTVTVNGKPVSGGWYFETKYQDPGHPIEADYRLSTYWPAHAKVHMGLNVKGLSAGAGLTFDNNLTLDFSTGPANILTVNDATHKLTVVSDGTTWGTFPVSLGASATPTRRGTKVIMEKGRSICMKGPGYNECDVKYTQRLTYDGEYLHAAPWNTGNIARGIDSSNGCTNLTTADAKKLYDFLEVGDVVKYPNASGAVMQLGDGYGAWNVPWAQWQTGGLYRVS